jgi:hypothetical protein
MLSQEKPDEALKILREEYRYRYELCWRVPVPLTTAAVALSTLPYLNCRVGGRPRKVVFGCTRTSAGYGSFSPTAVHEGPNTTQEQGRTETREQDESTT